MRRLLVSLFAGFLWLESSPCAFSAPQPQHSWLVVTTSTPVGDAGHKDELVAIRDDGMVRRKLAFPAPQKDNRVFSPDGKKWLEVRYDQGFSVRSAMKYLVVGDKGEPATKGKQFEYLDIESAQWTRDNNILVCSGFADWDSGSQNFTYSIVNPSTQKEVVDFKPLRDRLFPSPKYERDAVLLPSGSQMVFVAQTTAFGGMAAEYDTDRNEYLISFDWKQSQPSIIASFKNIGKPQLSPTGAQCLFSGSNGWNRRENTNSANIYICELDTFKVVFPLTYSAYENSDPTWSPDGKRIAWISNRPLKEGDKTNTRHLYTMNADGTDQKVLTPDIAHITSVRWQKEEPK